MRGSWILRPACVTKLFDGVDQLQSSFRHLKIMVAGITLALNCLFAYSWRTYVDTRIHDDDTG